MKSVSYATYCCPKDRERAMSMATGHMMSHEYSFSSKAMIFQRCEPEPVKGFGSHIEIKAEGYKDILDHYGIKNPDPVLDELTHGFGGPHFWQNHMVNHLCAAIESNADYMVFSDADCYIKSQPAGESWITKGIEILENDARVFVVSPNDGGDERFEDIMSQQMFLVDLNKFKTMQFIPWDGKFIEGGPFQEYYGLLEGWIARHMKANGLYRYVLGPEYRYYHLQWH